LIVEDNKNQMITKMLESKGVICEVIDNGEDSIKAVKKTLRLSTNGCSSSGINGTIATQRIREFDSRIPSLL
jgi:CheY-like chemotaxis protein